ncbi:hypothetical protein NG821_09290 [Prevotella cerevisiae]|uniref:Uncharacterized protein n=1 Tax=Segatella cerevisiae TaxID=2053716 RepID=A0ABT1BYH4_9BACT|nr:hypothetical protein [Segatella cerevisiae]MCO6026029.1 hypothetical protein [Segatella cerevisiae]
MKKFIYSIAALAAIVVMGSCSQDSDLTETSISKSKIDSVTVSLNINSGIEVSGSSSNMGKSTVNSNNTSLTRAARTRADETNTETPSTNFAADLSKTTYTAYFVATEAQGDYKAGQIVRKITGIKENTATKISVPALPYKVYVTNYDTDAPEVGGTESSVTDLEKNLPESSSTLYLFGVSNADLSSGAADQKISVNLKNNYAAVCVSNNDFVTGVTYNLITPSTGLPYITAYSLDSWNQSLWYYMYIRADLSTSTSPTSNSTIKLNTTNMGEGASTIWPLNNPITADQIYQYTVKSVKGGVSLTVAENVFTQTNSNDLNVY